MALTLARAASASFAPCADKPTTRISATELSWGRNFGNGKPALLPCPVVRVGTSRGRLIVRDVGGRVPEEHKHLYEEIEHRGPDLWNRTYYPKERDHLNVEKKWYIVDATQLRLGRLASTIANHIRGKDLPTYTPSIDMGAYVVVVNAEKVDVTGKKRFQKLYRRHSGRPGGMKEETFDQLQQRIPERIVEKAVRGMLPKGRLGRELFTHLKVYKGETHPHTAQKPEALPIRDKRIQMPS